MAHGNGIGVINLETEEDIRKWREERRKNYPTAAKGQIGLKSEFYFKNVTETKINPNQSGTEETDRNNETETRRDNRDEKI